mgnify:CR=1 FL=1
MKITHRIHIFYFSGTGNTWWCTKKIEERLIATGNEVSCSSIEQVTRAEVERIIAAVDIIGIGYPIYGSDLPEPMKIFIDEVLPETDSVRIRLFTFCTQLIYSGDGGYVYKKELKAKGWPIFSAVHLIMPNNISVTVFPISSTNDRKKIDKKLLRAEKKIARFTKRLFSATPKRQGHTLGSFMLGIIQRGPFRLGYKRLQNDITIDHDKCTRCMRCVKICSAGNLLDIDEKITAQGNCMLCLRCYNYCPVQAIVYYKRPHIESRGIPYRGPVPEFRPEMICKKDSKELPG